MEVKAKRSQVRERHMWWKREREEGILKRSAHLNGNSEYADARADATHMLIK